MSRFLNGLFGPDVPVWACELTPSEAMIVRSSDNRKTIRAMASEAMKPGALVPRTKGSNVVDSPAVRSTVGKALEDCRFSGSEIVLVIPDDAVRIALIDVESFPSGQDEQLAFIRWKFKKNVPFDVASARVTWEKIGGNGVNRLLAVLTPESVVRQYEEVMESFGLHPGLVVPSTLAALGLLADSGGDIMFVKKSPTAITTSVVTQGQVRFYRKVSVQSLYGAAYPTYVYYQDKLGGSALGSIVLCGAGIDPAEQTEMERALGVSAESLYSSDIQDLYKPALGALQQ